MRGNKVTSLCVDIGNGEKLELLTSSTTMCEMDLNRYALRANCNPFSSGSLRTMIPKWASGGGSLVVKQCLTLCNPVDCNPPGSSVHGILQARILESVAILFSRGSSQPRD